MTIPEVTTSAALGIITTVSDRVPALGDAAGWNARFGRELNATEDRPQFVPLGSRARLRPIIEGKQLSPFQVDLSRSTHGIQRHDHLARPDRVSRRRQRHQQADADRGDAAARTPSSTHTVFCLKTDLDERSQWCLLGLLNSLVANYLVRLNVTTHVTAALMSRLPVPKPPRDSRAFDRLVTLARSLASTGIDGNVTAYAELNAIAARSLRLIDRSVFVRARFVPATTQDASRHLPRCSRTGHGDTEARSHIDQNASSKTSQTRSLAAAVAVHRAVGPGLAEQSYQAAMAIEMTDQGLTFVREPSIAVTYKGEIVGHHRPDFVVENASLSN